jgi:hypothetical protein
MRVHYFQTGKVRTLKRRIARTWEKVAGKVVGKCLPPPALGKSSLCLVWVLSPKQKRQEVDKPFHFFPYWTVVLQ